MFGGRKFSRNSEILRDRSDDRSNVEGAIATVNDGLFQQINEAENHAKQILKTGQTQYVSGIKQNILDMIRLWLQEEGSNVFTLYGKMGCGKSFFSARLYQEFSAEDSLYDTVAFSSQQLYRDTTIVRNMLLSIAHQLFNTVPACTAFFAKHPLSSESLSALTEEVFILPFEGVTLQKTVFIIVDGLDEYPRQDCELMLEALGRLRMRLNPRVKIYFSSRPEAYVMSEMINSSELCSYHIEKNKQESHADCGRFIDAKCAKAGIRIDDSMKRALIEKSECSLKYLECFFNDIACGSIQVTADFIESLPMGLSHYYRDQLVRYFGDEGLRFYQTKIVPLLELLCVAWRPITIQDASDILGYRESEINTIISRSGTLLWRNGRYVMLYQSESIREFLIDERYCPERYLIDSQSGNDRVLQRLQEIMDRGDDLENNLYLFTCGVDHILGKDRILTADWQLLAQLAAHYTHKADVLLKLAQGVMEKTPREITAFLRVLASDGKIEPLLKDRIMVRLIGVTLTDKQPQKLEAVLELLEGQEEYDFMVSYGRIRMWRGEGKNQEALALLEPRIDPKDDLPESQFRHVHYLDEISRIYRKLEMVTWEENTDYHVRVVQVGEALLQRFPIAKSTPAHLCLVNSLAVSYDQLARLCDKLEKLTDEAARAACGQKLLEVLSMAECDPKQPGFFLLAEEAAFQKELRLCKTCQQHDPFSDSRIHQLHYPFYALGILYFRKDFPACNPDKALQYFEDCLDSIEEIASRPDSHIRFIDVVVKLYLKLKDIYLEEKQYALAKKYFAEAKYRKEQRYLFHPSADTDFSRCYSYEQEADLVVAELGIDAAEPYYLTAVQHYTECCNKYPDRFVQRSLSVVYFRLAKQFKEAGDLEKYIHYSRLELTETERLYGLYPSDSLRWDWGVTKELLANALGKVDPAGTVNQRLELRQGAIRIYEELAAANPGEQKYFAAPFTVYYQMALDFQDAQQITDALNCLDVILDLGIRIAPIIRTHDNVLELPVRLFLLLRDSVTEDEVFKKYVSACKTYLEAVIPHCRTEELDSMALYLLRQEFNALKESKGFEEAEPIMLQYTEQAKAYVEAYPSPANFYRYAFGYVILYQGHTKNRDKALRFLQEALSVLSQGLSQWGSDADMLELQAILYGRLTKLLGRTLTADQVSEMLDLYILQIKNYALLFKLAASEEKKEKFGKEAGTACAHMGNYLKQQEGFLKHRLETPATDKAQLRKFVKIMVTGYAFLNEFKIPDAQEKLDHYTELLESLEEE